MKTTKLTKKLLVLLCCLSLLSGTIYAESPVVDSSGSTSTNVNDGLDASQSKQTEYNTKENTDTTSSADVYVSQASTFAVVIPKVIILSGKTSSAIYEVNVKGDIGGLEEIQVTPEDTFTLQDTKNIKSDIFGYVNQEKTIFKYSSVKENQIAYTTGTVYAENMSAGNWSGSFNFNIFLYSYQPGELVLSSDNQSNLNMLLMSKETSSQVSATINGEDVSNEVNWVSDNPNIIVENGNIIVGENATAGETANITVKKEETLITKNSIIDTLSLTKDVLAEETTTITKTKSFNVVVIDIALDKETIDLEVGDSETIQAMLLPGNLNDTVVWKTNSLSGIQVTSNGNSATIKVTQKPVNELGYIVTAIYGKVTKSILVNVISHEHELTLIEEVKDTNILHGYKKYECSICKEIVIIENTEPLVATTGLEVKNISVSTSNVVMDKKESLVFNTTLATPTYSLIGSESITLDGSIVSVSEDATTQDKAILTIKSGTTTQTINIYIQPEIVDNAYNIYNAYDLARFRDIFNLNIEETPNVNIQNDIDLSNVCSSTIGSWIPIGSSTNQYNGIFEGNNFNFRNFYINNANNYNGLISYSKIGANIKNFNIYGDINTTNNNTRIAAIVGENDGGVIYNISNYMNIKGGTYVGGIVGFNSNGEIENCNNYGKMVGIARCGGITGYANLLIIKGCKNYGNISSQDYCGGIAGISANDNSIINSSNYGEITASGNARPTGAGGIVGEGHGNIIACFNVGNVTGGYAIGGITGASQVKGFIDSCYNIGKIKATTYAASTMSNLGGIVGRINNGIIVSNCYNLGDIIAANTNLYYIGGIIGNIDGLSGYVTKIDNCYNVGNISAGTNSVGSIIGRSYYGTIANVYNATSKGYLGYNNGGNNTTNINNITQEQLKNTTLSKSGMFFVDDNNQNNGYPILYWQKNEINTLQKFLVLKVGQQYEIKSGLKDSTFEIEDNQNINLNGNVIVISNNATSKDKTILTIKNEYYEQKIEILVDIQIDNDNNYILKNKDDVYRFSYLFNNKINTTSNLKLLNDIDLIDMNSWIPIGTTENQYNGLFDGNNFNLYNFNVEDKTKNNICLFKNIGETGNVQNLNIFGTIICNDNVGIFVDSLNGTINNCKNYVSISGNSYLGGIANSVSISGKIYNSKNNGPIKGANYIGGISSRNNGLVENCINNSDINGLLGQRPTGVGGIVGESHGTINSSHNLGDIVGGYAVGGITGVSQLNGGIYKCYNTGNIKANVYSSSYHANVGGISGRINGGIFVENCYNMGIISTTNTKQYCVGGIVGKIEATSDNKAYLTNSYNVGEIFAGTNKIGSIVGSSQYGNISNCFYTTSKSGVSYNDGGSTFTNILKVTSLKLKQDYTILGINFKQDTNLINNGYPVLNWQ